MPLLPKPLIFSSVETWKISIFFQENQCFSGFWEKHVCAVFVHFSFQKSSQNPSKTRTEPFKNRCRKRVDFQHRFFEVLASIWEGLGPPRWSQVGHFGFKTLGTVLPKSVLKLDVFWNGVLEGSRIHFGGSRARFWRVWGRFFETFASFLACCLEDVPPLLTPEIPPAISSMLVELMRLKRWAIAES